MPRLGYEQYLTNVYGLKNGDNNKWLFNDTSLKIN